MRRFALLAVLAVGMVVAAEKKADPVKDIEGKWVIVAVEKGGEKAPEDTIKALDGQLTLKDGKYELSIGGNKSSGTYKLNVSKTPIEVDVVETDGPNKGDKKYGITEIKGDTMRACWDFSGKERPKEFSGKGETHVLLVYKRVK